MTFQNENTQNNPENLFAINFNQSNKEKDPICGPQSALKRY